MTFLGKCTIIKSGVFLLILSIVIPGSGLPISSYTVRDPFTTEAKYILYTECQKKNNLLQCKLYMLKEVTFIAQSLVLKLFLIFPALHILLLITDFYTPAELPSDQ